MTKFRIVVMGTRGKSSVVRNLHNLFHRSGYSVLSRETGLFPIVYDNDRRTFLKREGSIPLGRSMEIKAILEMFRGEEHDIIVLENNAIEEDYARKFNESIRPDLVIITTISLDHILAQGGTLGEVAETFINSIPPGIPILFWTNHRPEYRAFRKACRENGVNADILFGPLRTREQVMFKGLKKHLDRRGIRVKPGKFKGTGKIPDEIIARIKGRTFIDLGHINDVVHTALALDEIMARKRIRKIYLFLNFRADRPERVLVFADAFLPMFGRAVEGVIINSDSIALPASFLMKRIREKYFPGAKIPFYGCGSVKELRALLGRIPRGSTVVMVGNTAGSFGKALIKDFGLFRDTYPILDTIDIREK